MSRIYTVSKEEREQIGAVRWNPTCATCKWWKINGEKYRGKTLVTVGFCMADWSALCDKSTPYTWADATCPAWAEKEDAAVRAVKRIRADLTTAKYLSKSPEEWDAHVADVIREEYAE